MGKGRGQQEDNFSPQTVYDDPRPRTPQRESAQATRNTRSDDDDDTAPPSKTSKSPHADNRWPASHTSVSEILQLFSDDSSAERITYTLIYQKTDPEAELRWKDGIMSAVSAAYAEKGLNLATQAVLWKKRGRSKMEVKREKEKALEEEAGPVHMAIIQAKNSGMLKAVSKGPRGTIWRLHAHHLHVWMAIEVVQKVRQSVRFGEERLVFEIFGVR
jgi:hypothetical protein